MFGSPKSMNESNVDDPSESIQIAKKEILKRDSKSKQISVLELPSEM